MWWSAFSIMVPIPVVVLCDVLLLWYLWWIFNLIDPVSWLMMVPILIFFWWEAGPFVVIFMKSLCLNQCGRVIDSGTYSFSCIVWCPVDMILAVGLRLKRGSGTVDDGSYSCRCCLVCSPFVVRFVMSLQCQKCNSCIDNGSYSCICLVWGPVFVFLEILCLQWNDSVTNDGSYSCSWI